MDEVDGPLDAAAPTTDAATDRAAKAATDAATDVATEAASDDAIDAAWQAGRTAWTDVTVARDAFAAHVRPLGSAALARAGADLYLVVGCLAGDPVAIARCERDVLPDARHSIAAIDRDAATIDETMQRLRTALFVGDGASGPKLAQYAGRGPLKAWIGIAATRIALMMKRSRGRAKEVVASDDHGWPEALASISTANPELELLKRQYAAAFGEALRAAVATLEPRLRAVLRMSFAEDRSIDEIGAVYAVHRATAARWVQRACEALFEETRRLLVEKLRVTGTEVDRVAALVRSQFDVSLSQLLPR